MNSSNPHRIISLVPSISELLWDLGLKTRLSGITKFCIHPSEMFQSLPRIGGTKNLDIEKIRSLNPDLIIANKEENTKDQIELLQKEFNVHITDVNTFDDAIEMILTLGELTNRKPEAVKMVNAIINNFNKLNEESINKKVIYLIWKNPFMAVGTNTFIHSLLNKSGFKNCISESRYPVIELEEIMNLNPDYIFLSTEPFPFTEENRNEFKDFPMNRIHLVDGEMFSWYGSRLLKAPEYFISLYRQLQ